MVARLAPLVFFQRQKGMAGRSPVFVPMKGKTCAATLYYRDAPLAVGQEVPNYVRFTYTGFGHSMQLKIELSVKHVRGVGTGSNASTVDKVWEGDWVHMEFALPAEGNVAAVTVTFQNGFARRRAALLGRVLGEVMKDASPSKAQMLSEALAGCEGASKGEAGGKGSHVHIVPGGPMVGSYDEHRVRVTTHPCDNSGNTTVDLRIM